MPELPEVETVRRGLQERALGQVVAQVEVGHRGILEDCSPEDLRRLEGCTLDGCDRLGKYLLLRWSGAPRPTLVVHLGMSGQLTFRRADEEVVSGMVRLVSGYRKSLGPPPLDRHVHLRIAFRSGGEMVFRDPRRFGRVLWLAQEASTHPRLERLGPDAMSFSPRTLARRLQRDSTRDLKTALLDQSLLAGVGNIYADEALHRAELSPHREMSGLTEGERGRLARAVLAVLKQGIEASGTTFRDFVDLEGHRGSNAEKLRVYGRGGLPCLRCGGSLLKETVAGRGTVWCPSCQG